MKLDTFRERYYLSQEEYRSENKISKFEILIITISREGMLPSRKYNRCGEIKDIMLKEPEPSFPYWILAILLALVIGTYFFTKSRNTRKT